MRLTRPQMLIYNAENYIGGSVSVMCGIMTVDCPCEQERLQGIIREIYRTNPALNMRLDETDDSPGFVVVPRAQTEIPVVTVDDVSELDAIGRDLAHTPFDIHGALSDLRGVLYPGGCGIILRFHHLIGDAWSASLIGTQFNELLSGRTVDRFDYSDYVKTEDEYLNSRRYQRDRDWFMTSFRSCQNAVLFRETNSSDYHTQTLRCTMNEKLQAHLTAFTKAVGMTEFECLFAIFSLFYAKYTGCPDGFYIGVPVVNRVTEQELNTVGMYVNTVPVPISPLYDQSLQENLEAIQDTVFSVFRHQRFNYNDFLQTLREEEHFEGRLYDTLFNYQSDEILSERPMRSTEYTRGMYPETLQLMFNRRNGETALTLDYIYRKTVLSESEIKRIHNLLIAFIDSVLQHPDMRLKDVSLLAAPPAFSVGPKSELPGTTVWDLFEKQGQRNADKIAVAAADRTLTYAQLKKEACRLAQGLLEQGVKPGDIVAFCLPRDSRLLAAMLGILRAGAAYLPLDPQQPEERRRFILEDSGAKLCITEENYEAVLSAEPLQQSAATTPDSICYCIYTSGSTGLPKGTLLTQRNVVNYVGNSDRHMNGILGAESKTVLSVTSVGFDIFVTESLLPLVNGKSIVLANERQSQFGSELQYLLKQYPADVMQTTPSKMRVFLQSMTDETCLQQMKCIVLGGETLDKPLVERLKAATSARICNVYGPTETTVWVTCARIDSADDITIGQPLANTQIYILDQYQQPVPIGVTGELCVAGDNVGQGYLNRSELTAEKFVDNPFGEGKLYRTGDLAYWREDGNLIFVGRNDYQVKLNGQRVELGEIEAALSSQAGIDSAAVIVRKEEADGQMLCAFYTGQPQEQQELRRVLLKTLPRYMVPQAFAHLDAMPLTASGKIDRTALQDQPVEIESETYEAPVTDEEKALATVIGETLGIERVGRQDNFFSLGGDSIRAIHVVSELQRMGYALNVSDLMRGEAIGATALRVEKYVSGSSDKDERGFTDPSLTKEEKDEILAAFGEDAEDVYELTPAQEGMYTETLKNDGRFVYQVHQALLLAPEDPEPTKELVAEMMQRHPVLRTAFVPMRSTGRVLQVILRSREPEYQTVSLDKPYSREEVAACFRAGLDRPFDLQKDSLLRICVLHFLDKTALLCSMHHLVSDGWSVSLLAAELLSGNKKPELYSFAQYVRALRKTETEQADEHWAALLSGAEIHPMRNVSSQKNKEGPNACAAHETKIDAQAVERAARAASVTPNAVFESAFGLLLQRYSGADDVLFCKAISGRSMMGRTDYTVGPFLNTVPVRIRQSGDGSVADLLEKTQKQSVYAERFGFLSLSGLLSSSGLQRENIDALFAFENYFFSSEHEALSRRLQEKVLLQSGQTEFPLCLTVWKGSKEYICHFDYDENSFTETKIASLTESYLTILHQICQAPDLPVKQIEALTQAQKKTMIGFSVGQTLPLPETTVWDLFEKQAASTLDMPRITDGEKSYTFTDLRAAAEKTDAFIRSRLGEEKQVIGVLCDRSFWELAAIFGVIRGGNAYLPISPQYPPARIQSMLKTSGCKLVLAQKQFAHLVDCTQCVEELVEQPASAVVPEPAAQPDDTLYVIYTSGSTGTPKGAMVSNRSAVNRIQWMKNRFFDETTVVMRKTPYTFDVSVWEIFGFAMYGFSLYLLPPDEHYNQQAVLSHIEKGQVTDLHFVPTVFEQFLTVLRQTPQAKQMMRSVRHIILSGETLLAKDVNAFHRYHDGQIRIHNLYGPAECAVDVTAYECTATETDPIPIGRPIDNTQIYILDQYQQPVPIGVTGELCIAGDNVGQGYLNDPDLTAKKFIDNPFGEGKLYRTGDLAYWREDGNIVFVGRNDFQVKLNGQRVELGEIEAALSSQAGIDSAAVIVRKEEAERQILCAFYTGQPREQQELRRALLKTLPRYMVPQAFAHLDAMPLTASGKIDRRALSARLVSPESASFGYEPPQNLSEKQICQLFSDVLKIEKVGRRDSFYDLGGSSLQLVRLLSMPPLNTLSAADFLAAQTPAALAQMLAKPLEKEYNYLIPLSEPEDYQKAVVLFPYAGGDAGAYTELVGKAGNSRRKMALFYVDWAYSENSAPVIEEIRTLAQKKDVVFYSHCAGSALALELLDCLNAEEHVVKGYIAAASVPSPKARLSFNAWNLVNDSVLVRILTKAGLDTKDMEKPYLQDMLARFRQQTSFYVRYFAKKTKRTNVKTTVIVSSRDPFTQNYKAAEEYWKNTVTEVQRLILIDCPSHYFQNSESELLLSLFSDDR